MSKAEKLIRTIGFLLVIILGPEIVMRVASDFGIPTEQDLVLRYLVGVMVIFFTSVLGAALLIILSAWWRWFNNGG